MPASVKKGRDELVSGVQQVLALPTKKEAEVIVNAVVSCLECTLLHNLATDGFTLKLKSFGKFSVRHKPGILAYSGRSRSEFRGDVDHDSGLKPIRVPG
jgi:nucleoid DNA-binding protein